MGKIQALTEPAWPCEHCSQIASEAAGGAYYEAIGWLCNHCSENELIDALVGKLEPSPAPPA